MATGWKSHRIGVMIPALAALAGVACQSESISGSADPVAIRVTMQRAGGAGPAQAVADWFASAVSTGGRIDLSNVDSLMVTLTGIEFLPAVQEEGDGNGEGQGNGEGESNGDMGGWVSLDVEDLRLDLLALPTAADAGIVLATGELPAGDYLNVRLFVSDVTIWFNTGMQVGPAAFDPDVEYSVFVPSGDQTGIKTDQGFTIPAEGGDVGLVFDENASLANVTATGNGRVILAPVIHVAAGAGQE